MFLFVTLERIITPLRFVNNFTLSMSVCSALVIDWLVLPFVIPSADLFLIQSYTMRKWEAIFLHKV